MRVATRYTIDRGMQTTRKRALNTGDLTGGVPHHDAHVITRILRAVTVVFYPADNLPSVWSYIQPEETDLAMAHLAAKGLHGVAYVYRGAPNSVNTLRDTPSSRIAV